MTIQRKSNQELAQKADRLWNKASEFITEMNGWTYDVAIPEKWSSKGNRLMRRAYRVTDRMVF